MDPEILSIRLSEESKRWDEMVDRLMVYLDKQIGTKQQTRDNYISQQAEKDKSESELKKHEQPEDDFSKDIDESQHVDVHGNLAKTTYQQSKQQIDLDKEKQMREFEQRKYGIQVFEKEELDLIATGFKSQLSEVRTAIKNVDILLKKSKFESKKNYLDQYRVGLRADLISKGEKQIEIIDRCIEACGTMTTLIFFRKMKADINRYMAEVSTSEERQKYKEEALKLYQEAESNYKMMRDNKHQNGEDDVIDCLRLGFSLNYAVFLYEINNDQKKAIRILKKEIQDALDDFDKWQKDEIEQIKQQIELIQENINLWKQHVDTDSEEEN